MFEVKMASSIPSGKASLIVHGIIQCMLHLKSKKRDPPANSSSRMSSRGDVGY